MNYYIWTEIQLEVYAENESALKAYTKIGFRPDILQMRLDLVEKKLRSGLPAPVRK